MTLITPLPPLPPSRQLFVSDLDGTLLDNDSRVSPRSAQMLAALSARGALITCATARTPATVSGLLADCHLHLPAIVFTGAAEWDVERNRYTRLMLMDRAVADDVAAECRAAGVNLMRYTVADDHIIDAYCTGLPVCESERQFIEGRSGLPFKRWHMLEAVPERAADRTLMFFAISSVDRVMQVAQRLRRRGDCAVSAYPEFPGSEVGILEVFSPQVSKAAAVSRLARRLGVERVTVFGDNLNDLSMMAVADVAVAVENAAPEVRQAADIVIGPNSCDSVASYIAAQLQSPEDVE